MFNPSANYWRMQNMIQLQLIQQALRQSHMEYAQVNAPQTQAFFQKSEENSTASSDDYSSENDGSVSSVTVQQSPAKTKECKFCPAVFKSNTDLRRHERIHTGEKPFKCSICEKEFNRKGNMEKHMTTHFKGKERYNFLMNHSSDKPYVCPCGKSFRSKGFFERHQQKHREENSPNSRSFNRPSVIRSAFFDDDIFERKRESLQNLSKPIGFFSCHRCSEEFSAASGLTEHFAKCKMFSGPYYVNEDEIINVD